MIQTFKHQAYGYSVRRKRFSRFFNKRWQFHQCQKQRWSLQSFCWCFFLVVEKFSRSNVSNQKRKVDVKQVVSSLIMDFSILSHFTALRNSASAESEKEIYSTVR